MALWKISEFVPISYRTCEEYPCTSFFLALHPDTTFCHGNILYSERLSVNWGGISQFYYYPAEDRYFLDYAVDCCQALGLRRMLWGIAADGQSNAVIIGDGIYSFLDISFITSRRGIEVGSYGKIYCTVQFMGGDGGIGEIDPYTLLPVDNGWAIPYTSLPNFPGWGYVDAPGHSLVNREDGIIMLNLKGSPEMHFWDISIAPYTYLGKMTAPGNLADVSYEDRYRFWLVTENGYIQKINYHLLRTELLSEVQDRQPTDLNYRIAWDQKRFRLAVFRQTPDAPDGSCTSKIEFYRPLPKVSLLTDPVPIRPLRSGKRIPFSFHLVGTAGEGISPYMIEAELEAPVNGTLERTSMGSGQYGTGGVEYQAPTEICEETLTLRTTLTDGQEA